MIRISRSLLILAALAGLLTRAANALHIQVGDHLLVPNQAGQTIDILVTGGEPVSGVNLYAQVGDGGPELADYGLPAGVDGPAISAVDLKTGGIFASVPDPAVNQGSLPQVAIWSLGIAAPQGQVAANGKLVTLTVDTTGFSGGRWDLKLKDVLSAAAAGPFATDFAGTSAVVANGALRINAGIPGDTNADGQVDVKDLNNVRNNFGAAGGHPLGDTTPYNNVVGIEDLNAVRNFFGTGNASPTPEPHAIVLGVVILLPLLPRGFRRRPFRDGLTYQL